MYIMHKYPGRGLLIELRSHMEFRICFLMKIIIISTLLYSSFGIFLIGCFFSIEEDRLIEKTNHHELLKACRIMIKNRKFYKTNRPDLDFDESKGTYISFPYSLSGSKEIPNEILRLKPKYLIIRDDKVTIILRGGFSHLGIKAYMDGVTGNGDKKLIEGLWLISN